MTIRVTPRARKTEISGIMDDGTLRIRISAPRSEGKANKALIKYLSKILGVRKNRIDIVAGEKSLDKIVSILDMSAEEVQKQILKEIGS
ncbi:MAG: DUF167 domain-containing protein [Anaerolineales bacterium]|nr:DUF167 domain-containing protein [Anaerolineales bacterium]